MPLPINELNSEGIAVLASLKPASVNAGTAVVGPVNMTGFQRLLFVLDIGVIAGGSTIDAKVQTSATSGGTYADLANSSITQVTVSASGKVVEVEVKAETVAAAGVGPWVQLLVTVGTAACIISGKCLSGHVPYAPASDNNVAAVVQTLVV